MTHARPAWLVGLLLAAMLAGCTGAPADDGPVVVTDPDDFSQFGNNTTGAQRPHIHDYWGGQDRLPVMDLQDSLGLISHNSASAYVYYSFRPDEGSIIPLGTSQVEITVSWDDAPPNYRLGDGPLELWIQTAADDSAAPFTQLPNGETVVFESSNEQNDIPHQVLSAWRFVIAVPNEDTPATYGGSHVFEVQLTVEAVRGLDIPPYPGHVDPWQDQTSIDLMEAGRDLYRWVAAPGESGCVTCSGGTDGVEFRPDDGRIIPYDADHIEVIVQDEHLTPEGLHLIYHGADTWEWRDAERVEEDGDTHRYIIPVEGNGDSPYALQSVWRFAFRHESSDSQPVVVSAGDYGIQATVHKEAPAA